MKTRDGRSYFVSVKDKEAYDPKKPAFVFDLEGVLVDHLPRQCEIATKALASIGIKMNVDRKVYQLRSEKQFHCTKDFISGLYTINKFGLSIDEFFAHPENIEHYRKMLTKQDWQKIEKAVKEFDEFRQGSKKHLVKSKAKAFPFAKKLLKVLKDKGHLLVIATFGSHKFAENVIKSEGLHNYVDRIYYGEDKVNKDLLFGYAAEYLKSKGVDVSKSYVVEDSVSGIKNGHKHGFKTILVLTGNTSYARVRSMAEKNELRPTIVLNNAARILEFEAHQEALKRIENAWKRKALKMMPEIFSRKRRK